MTFGILAVIVCAGLGGPLLSLLRTGLVPVVVGELAAGVIVGILVSLGQILTSIQDPAVGAVPRLLAMGFVLAISLPWMSARLLSYTHLLWSDFARYGH